jgi:hypothetical protein
MRMHVKRWDHAGYMGSFETVFYHETAVKKKKPVTKVPRQYVHIGYIQKYTSCLDNDTLVTKRKLATAPNGQQKC